MEAAAALLEQFGLDPQTFLIAIVLSSGLFVLLYRKFFLNIFDPLTVFLIDMVACTTLIFTLGVPSQLRIEFVAFVVFFWLGFCCFRLPKKQGAFELSSISLFELETVLIGLFIIIVIGNLYIGFTSGFPIFSSNPTTAKVEEFTGGAGIIRRVNGLPYDFFAAGCVVLAILRRARWLFLLLLTVGSLSVVLAGSKGALLPLIFILAFVSSRQGLVDSFSGGGKRMRRYAAVVLVFGIVVAMFIAGRDVGGGFGAGFVGLLTRIIMSGDVVIFYYPNHGANPALVGLGPINYIGYLLAGILGELRIVPYSDALGTVIMGSGGDTGLGPNAQYFVRADLFFGPILGCIYSFVLGYFASWMRRQFLAFSGNNALILVWSLTLATFGFALAVESQFFVSQIFDLVLLVFPIWSVAKMISIAIASSPSRQLS